MRVKTLRNPDQIIEPLGSGGFGDTYKAIDLGRPSKHMCC